MSSQGKYTIKLILNERQKKDPTTRGDTSDQLESSQAYHTYTKIKMNTKKSNHPRLSLRSSQDFELTSRARPLNALV